MADDVGEDGKTFSECFTTRCRRSWSRVSPISRGNWAEDLCAPGDNYRRGDRCPARSRTLAATTTTASQLRRNRRHPKTSSSSSRKLRCRWLACGPDRVGSPLRYRRRRGRRACARCRTPPRRTRRRTRRRRRRRCAYCWRRFRVQPIAGI